MKQIFKIHGGGGDILAAIPFMKELGGGDVLILKNMKGVPDWHPVNHGGAEMLIPFMESQGLSAKVINQSELGNHEYTIDMDKRVDSGWHGSKGDVLTWNSLFYGVYPDMTKPFFEIEDVVKEDFILITRTARYGNPALSYDFLNDINRPKKFLGTDSEFDWFNTHFNIKDMEHHKVGDYLEAAKLIKKSVLFISNQTAHYFLAEGIAHPRILMVSPDFPSVIPKTPNGRPVIYQSYFEKAVHEYI